MNVAVVIPVYNTAPYLKRCLDSVCTAARELSSAVQPSTFNLQPSVEIVCVDDGSTDGSGDMLDAYAEQLKSSPSTSNFDFKVLHQTNAGQSVARNVALDLLERERKATHVTFVDSDDWVAPNYLEELARGVALGADASAVMLRRVPDGSAEENVLAAGSVTWTVDAPRAYWALPDRYQSAAGGKLYDLRLFDGVRYPVGQVTEDEATLYRLFFRAKKVAHADAELYAYRVRENSTMGIAWTPRRLDRLQAWRDQIKFFGGLGYDELVANSRRGLTIDLVDAVRNLKSLGEKDRAETCRRELAEQLKAGRCDFSDYYLAYKTAHPFRTRILKMLGGCRRA